MKFVVTNDDGIDAPGLEALAEAARRLGEIAVVAPGSALSGCSHQVTTSAPIRVTGQASDRYLVHGTPADCVRLALHGLVSGASWVLSGINSGGNLGADVYHSGTVAAVREAALHGLPGIAISQYRKRGQPIDWQQAAGWAGRVLGTLFTLPQGPGAFWNVNLPHLEPGEPMPEVVFCPLDPGPLPVAFRQEGENFHYAGDYHQRRRAPGADAEVCFNGKIAVTRITL